MSPHSRKILILDDNMIDRETCRRYLARHTPDGSYFFLEHGSIEGAMDLALTEKPDCILLDYHLHDGNGLEFLRDLKEHSSAARFPVIMLTGTGSETIAVEVMKIGAYDYLMKDRLTPEILHRTITSVIYKASTERLLEAQRLEMQRLFLEAQEANARKDHFLATLSHELRTPLTPVLAAVSLLEQDNISPEEIRETAAIIRRNIELEARLIDDMLDLTRIAKGKFSIELRPLDVRAVIESALEICRDDIARQHLHIVRDFQAPAHWIAGDNARLQQVFWNLLKNAVKFTPAGGTITLSTRGTGRQLEVRVRDTGIGIPPEKLESIFQSFEQGSPNVTRRFGGLGLGLAICRALVGAQGGTIRAENVTGSTGWDSGSGSPSGAEFILTFDNASPSLPAGTVPASAGPSAPAASPSGPPAAASSQGTVLLVEDHQDSIHLLSLLLRRLGYTVLTASTAAQAETLYQEHHGSVDCVISDIGLPDSTGRDLIRRLHAIRSVPSIAISGYGMEADIRASREAGFNRHIIKPVTREKLAEALNDLIRRS